jgi:hypothetical protein
MLLVLCSFTYAESDWQTSIYASQEGLQITYPKLDFYKVEDKNLTFNFNVFDINNTILNNDSVQCQFIIFENNGSRIINDSLLWDGINFYYNWNTTIYDTPRNFYYLLLCNRVDGSAKGFTSNNIRLNINSDNDTVNSTAFIALMIMVFGVIFVLFFIAERIEFGYFVDGKGQPIPFFKYLAWLVSGWLLLIPIQTAIKLIAIYNLFDSTLYDVVYSTIIYVMLFLTTIWLVGFVYKVFEIMDMFGKNE